MGYAMARAAAAAGAEVVLISGPVELTTPDNVQRVGVESAKEMFAATHERIDNIDIFIAAAAVADYSAASTPENKIKKSEAEMSIELKRTPDILASVAKLEKGPFTVGFAAETEKLREYARSKLEKKKLDMIIANQVGENRGFDSDENTVDVFWAAGEQSFPMMPKTELAVALIKLITERFLQGSESGSQSALPAIAARD
jgi:phosphopantothenoylcysteine decarboxylase/phosphopantothenate--cysteine ligase